ncbi:hypothetical protein [Methylomonas albis]|uniref:DUF1674 domain-containing protein n=1 Tax=Methylomonas albis TaxID=1854563 RepID=A0ABR9CYQ4_9GAMM|nr:succinate dehydrogenase assembly factor 4 [Methylomonas albis]MBD9355661.1 DUF1674 domain-containing protein [Methylomonas albis]CAD6878675.1 hypothetical protein [Methylomonas albis]
MQKTDMKSEHTTNRETRENAQPEAEKTPSGEKDPAIPTEINGPKGPEPTRFGDWERKGRCVDF